MEIGPKKHHNGIRIFSSNTLKVIACISMLTDHIGLVFMENDIGMRAVGRRNGLLVPAEWHFLYLHSWSYRDSCIHQM